MAVNIVCANGMNLTFSVPTTPIRKTDGVLVEAQQLQAGDSFDYPPMGIQTVVRQLESGEEFEVITPVLPPRAEEV